MLRLVLHTVETFNFVRAKYRGLWDFWLIYWNVILWMRQFSVKVGKLNLLVIVFVKDVNSCVRSTHEYREYLAIMNSADSIVCRISWNNTLFIESILLWNLIHIYRKGLYEMYTSKYTFYFVHRCSIFSNITNIKYINILLISISSIKLVMEYIYCFLTKNLWCIIL